MLRMPRNTFLAWNALAALVSTCIGAHGIGAAVLGQLSARRGTIALAVAALADSHRGSSPTTPSIASKRIARMTLPVQESNCPRAWIEATRDDFRPPDAFAKCAVRASCRFELFLGVASRPRQSISAPRTSTWARRSSTVAEQTLRGDARRRPRRGGSRQTCPPSRCLRSAAEGARVADFVADRDPHASRAGGEAANDRELLLGVSASVYRCSPGAGTTSTGRFAW